MRPPRHANGRKCSWAGSRYRRRSRRQSKIRDEGSHGILTVARSRESLFGRSACGKKRCRGACGLYSSRPSNSGNPLFMSQHRSLKGQSTIAAKRNVLKRFERVELLKKRGQFKEGDKVMGLRKTKPDA